MRRRLSVGLTLLVSLAIGHVGVAPHAPAQATKSPRVISEQTATGFKFPESVAYDPQGKVLYVSQFGSELKPLEKDGKGKISRVSLDGKVLDEQFLPAAGGVLNKPKGIWIQGDRLWTTGDPRFHELDDLLQHLGMLTFRTPVPAYRHDAALVFEMRGWSSSDATPPGAPRRQGWERDLLADVLARLAPWEAEAGEEP